MSTRMSAFIPMRGMPKLGHFGPFFDVENDPTPSAATVLTRYSGDAVKMAEQVAALERDNYKQRDEIRTHKDTIKDLTGKVPVEGSVVLSAADAATWTAYQALNLAPADVTTRLTEADAAKSERDGLLREKTLRTVAEETGMKPGALATVDKLYGGLTYEVKTSKETINGKQVEIKRAYVKRDEKDVALADLVKADYPDIASILAADAVPAPQPNGTPPRDRPRPMNNGDPAAPIAIPTPLFPGM